MLIQGGKFTFPHGVLVGHICSVYDLGRDIVLPPDQLWPRRADARPEVNAFSVERFTKCARLQSAFAFMTTLPNW